MALPHGSRTITPGKRRAPTLRRSFRGCGPTSDVDINETLCGDFRPTLAGRTRCATARFYLNVRKFLVGLSLRGILRAR